MLTWKWYVQCYKTFLASKKIETSIKTVIQPINKILKVQEDIHGGGLAKYRSALMQDDHLCLMFA